MHSFTALLALAALAHAAPVAQKEAPDHYYEGYLEPYMTYHTRYITIGCSGQHGTQFFSDCCSPMLATETLEDARLPYCRPNGTESATVSASASATGSDSASPVRQTESADYEAQSEYSHALPSANAVAQEASSSSEAPAPTSTWSSEAAPEPTQEAPAPSGGDEHTGGFATYFHQNGNAGACGNVNSDGAMGIAIDHEIWGSDFSQGSEYCGRSIRITNDNNGKSVTAQVWDVCPTCANGNSLDLSVGAFNAIATESEGMVPISWSWA